MIEFTDEELEAIQQFFSYGATRGNHAGEGGTGAYPGPMSPYINAMGTAARKAYDILKARRTTSYALTHPTEG